ncbi:MAG TPA: UDP-N-acetylmuramoyl-tripeptide--D-alanyl-D-alanine ligase [bacterium]|nr:UDP-N-acetylmuramoyl-tripeptide--D-alanyl-D-alanine ligase [bacterium]
MFSFPEACRFLNLSPKTFNPSRQVTGASIDTRSLKPGDLFFALKGSRQDGHAYLEEAFRRGASGAVICSCFFDEHAARFLDGSELFQNLLPVPDPEKTLRDLAAWNRSRADIPVIGITGSVGKTSTKEFLSYLLGKRSPLLASSGNFNNHLGLPLTLLGLDPSHRYCVAELGANHIGEIKFLSALLKPTAGIITQISPAHLEGFGSLGGIYQAKLELFEALPKGAIAVIPDDDILLIQKAQKLKLNLIRVGTSRDAEFRISAISLENGAVSFSAKEGYRFSFPAAAAFFARNAAMALAMVDAMGIPFNEIPETWEDFKLPSGRFQEKRLGSGIRVIYDGYNASPASFLKALESFEALPVIGRKILVLADMLELGREEKILHEELGRQIAGFDFDCALAYGERAQAVIQTIQSENRSMQACHFRDSRELTDFLLTQVKTGDCLLLKASRGMKVEEVMNLLEEKLRFSPAGCQIA